MSQNIAGHIVKRKKVIPFSTSAVPTYKSPSDVYEEVYNTPEIRQRILSFLPRKELIKIVTLEKKIVADVAKEMYHTVTYRQVKKMRRTTEARAICADAVRHVTFDSFPITADLMKQFPILEQKYRSPGDGRRRPALLHRYDDSTVQLIIDDIRRTCPNLSVLVYDYLAARGDRPWVSSGRQVLDSWSVVMNEMGLKDVRIVSKITCTGEAAPDILDKPHCGSDTRIAVSYDLNLFALQKGGFEPWLKFFDPSSLTAHRLVALDLGRLPVPLDHIIAFLESINNTDPVQRGTEDQTRHSLEKLRIRSGAAVELSDIQRLGGVTGSSLRILDLQNLARANFGPSDLDVFEVIIPRDLPSSVALALTLDWDKGMESKCLEKLSPRLSSRSGKLYVLDLRMSGNVNVQTLFNLARRLNPFIRQKYSTIQFNGGTCRVESAHFCAELDKLQSPRKEVAYAMDMSALNLLSMDRFYKTRWDGLQPRPHGTLGLCQDAVEPFYEGIGTTKMSIQGRLEYLEAMERERVPSRSHWDWIPKGAAGV